MLPNHPAIEVYQNLMNGTHFEVKRQKDRIELRLELAHCRRSAAAGFTSAYRRITDLRG